ncbi:MAG: acyl-CoA dehydrogenase [Myxococcales bacterium]|nr:acyl-CoA dehydrogenase [Myxococcales bacterium]
MAQYAADVRDIKFVLFEQLDIDGLITTERFNDFSRDDIAMIVDEGYKLAREVFAPSNEPADREGCTIEDGKVTVPKVMREPWKAFIDGGWLGLAMNPKYGGQGAPDVLRKAVDDMFFGANISLNLGLLLTPSSGHLIEVFGTEALRKTYCEKMYTGVWSGTMCLTESGAGSDVGASKTKATKVDDHYLIEGEKIFITFGEHDLTENIVHCVLARVEGAPAGTKGLSLFCVPKFLPDANGKPGEFNNVVCAGIEHKMGINASPTCTMTFGANGPCKGWLLGDENRGMAAMFQMMNEARINVGMQGAALASAAMLEALRYAQERLQGSHIKDFKNADAPRTAIINHPDVRMMLMRQKAYCEGMRSMLMYTSYAFDREQAAKDEQEREPWSAVLDFLTPICKAYCTDMGFRVTEWALQCFGGYGYLKDYPAEQYMRDSKIASLYEGTNGIQALDLVGRKLGGRGGGNAKAVGKMVSKVAEKAAGHPRFGELGKALGVALARWGEVSKGLGAAAAGGNMLAPMLGATQYLGLCGDMLMASFLLEQALIADTALEKAGVDPADAKALLAAARTDAEVRFYDSKIKTARFFFANELPQLEAKARSVTSGDTSAMDIVWPELA